MSSSPRIEPFKGIGTWEECDDFVQAIRTAAWKEGKLRDAAWMADFASLHFQRKARLWHSRLPEDVRQDWSKLETSILTQWAPSEDKDLAGIEPTPAASPPHNRSIQADLTPRAVLKLILDGSNTTYYIKISESMGNSRLVTDVTEASRLRCITLSSATVLEPIGHSRHSWLAIQWAVSAPVIGEGSTNYAYITRLYSDDLKSSLGYPYPMQLLRCTVSENGEATLVWTKADNSSSKITMVPFICGNEPLLVTDPTTYSKKYPSEPRAKFFIEPITQHQ